LDGGGGEGETAGRFEEGCGKRGSMFPVTASDSAAFSAASNLVE